MNNNYAVKNKVRKFTKDSDVMLVIMHNEYESLEQIALILGRTEDSVLKRLKMLFETNEAEEIHRFLLAYDGLYARRVKKNMPKFRFEKEEEEK